MILASPHLQSCPTTKAVEEYESRISAPRSQTRGSRWTTSSLGQAVTGVGQPLSSWGNPMGITFHQGCLPKSGSCWEGWG